MGVRRFEISLRLKKYLSISVSTFLVTLLFIPMAPTTLDSSVMKNLRKRKGMIMRLGMAAALCCLCTLTFAAESAEASIRKNTNIPAEGLGAALQTLATTFDFQVLYRDR